MTEFSPFTSPFGFPPPSSAFPWALPLGVLPGMNFALVSGRRTERSRNCATEEFLTAREKRGEEFGRFYIDGLFRREYV